MAKKTPASKKKKNTTPELELVDESLIKRQADWLDAKKREKKAKADLKKAETDLIEAASEARVNHCTREGKYESSHKIVYKDSKITVKFPNRYSKIDCENKEDLRDIFEDDYNRYFKDKTTATLTQAAVDDDEFIETLVGAIGEDKFARYFEVSSHIEVAKSYHENRAINKALAEKHQEAFNSGLVNCTKPSLVAG
jgi:hypothetical protein